MTAAWSYQSSKFQGIYELHHGGKHVASAWWFHDPDLPAVAMCRLVDRLNLPAAECAPSPDPTWTLTLLPCTEGTLPAAWGTFSLDGVEVMAVVWEIAPLRLDEWHQRILDGLNAGRGLPAVAVPNLPRSAAA